MDTEFYPTPTEATDELVRELRPLLPFAPDVLDPGSGDGALGRALSRGYPSAYMYGIELDTSLHANNYYSVRYGDFLTFPVDLPNLDLIICNPPFSLAEEFVEKSLEWAHGGTVVAFLLRIDILGSQKRHDWWRGLPEKPKLRILSKRPSFTGDGKTDAYNYMWAIWGMPDGAPLDWYTGKAL